ncbi:alkaline phosphatase [Candidatus Ruminimicrobiellum ovillum]|uniref:alkaline phosphatase n=1 Tax=Candidatus Ruminimicrobiellum ovillum TaxID=1947927 RepID=UPI00355A3475
MKKFILILLFIFLFFLNIYADKPKYVFLIVAEGLSVSNEIALSNFLYGKDKMLAWNNFPLQTFMTTWSINSYIGQYNKTNFDSEKGYDTNLAGTIPYPYYKNDKAEKYFKNSVPTDSAASLTAMSVGQKVYNNSICYDKTNKIFIPNIVDKINEQKEYNTALITTNNFYSVAPASFFSHNKSKNNYNKIAEEILSKTKPEIIIGQNDIYEMNKFAAYNGYYCLSSSEINKPQVFNLVNKKLFVKLQKYCVPKPTENFTLDSFEYRFSDNKFSDVVSYCIKMLLEKKAPFFTLMEFTDIDKANCENDYNKMLGAVYDCNKTVELIYNLVKSNSTDMNLNNTVIIVVSPYSSGMLRFNKFLAKGILPRPNIMIDDKTFLKWDTSIDYKTKGNINELTGCYCAGAKSDLFKKYINEKNIIDNTDIYNVLNDIFIND